jgi:hypothetical protein
MEDEITQSRKLIKNNISRAVKSPPFLGGQQCQSDPKGVVLESEELGIKITIDHFRSQHQNIDYGLLLFDLIIDDLVK